MAVVAEEDIDGLVPRVLSKQIQLEEFLSEENDIQKKKILVKEYISEIITKDDFKVPDFGSDLDWLNTSRSLSLHQDLKKRVVVLDFFTYCCINCMHVLPSLKKLEEKFPLTTGLVVVGVHSAKFNNERLLKSIGEAILRNNIEHPVVNDPEATVWNSLQIQCWPTLLIIGPESHLLFGLVGESNKTYLSFLCETVLEYFEEKQCLFATSLPVKLLKESLSNFTLLFPGKVCTDLKGETVIVSDTGHNRILIVGRNGIVKDVIGSKKQGFRDGSFNDALFNSPQGITWKDPGLIYVADTGNHAIRLINIQQKRVETVAGNGIQGCDRTGGKVGNVQQLNSPWDVCIGPGIDSNIDGNEVLYIAMAGNHQIWALFLEDCKWLKGSFFKRGLCLNFAGSGVEENRNNSYPHRAGFAQPSGITLARDEASCYLYVADSESSTIRSTSLIDGSVKNVVGGNWDPQDLFAFGDKDGCGLEAKLQHPLGIGAYSSEVIYIADSYNHKERHISIALRVLDDASICDLGMCNHAPAMLMENSELHVDNSELKRCSYAAPSKKIKILNPRTKECKTYSGTGNAGNKIDGTLTEVEFNEPSDVTVTDEGKTLLVADTNNHCIKIIDVISGSISEFPVVVLPSDDDLVDMTDSSNDNINSMPHIVEHIPSVHLMCGGRLKCAFNIHIDDDAVLTEGAPQHWKLSISGAHSLVVDGSQEGSLKSLTDQPTFTIKHIGGNEDEFTSEVNASIRLYLCQKSNKTCCYKTVVFYIPIQVCQSGSDQAEVLLSCFIKL